ncbi:hypothetical protein FZC78_07545 [Rossellomorea vietnamensis]|uniref:DUF6843 domain-containing protein n=1 Tax=Rossellomorea vietnamensis TaxID=218284 RepID=A0A5D4NWL4_9BACI|nr:hypothetical protein [Rossellomorea vietnamensis]TYS17706.1 hypothetical protein FZC78_07545 [Rossellomorea vietnamensis]
MLEKLKPALYSTLIIFSFFFIPSLFEEGAVWFSFIVLFYAAAGNFLFGIPVSLISDLLTRKLDKGRFLAAAGIHIFFGAVTIIFIDGLAFFAVVCAALFFLLDEWEKGRRRGNKQIRGLALKGGVVLAFVAVVIIGMMGHEELTEVETNTIYLIPEGFEGPFVVYYNVPDQPPLKQEGEFSVVPINIEKLPPLEGTGMEKYGLYQTSTEASYGTVTDRFYYVNDSGNRTEVDQYCIHPGFGGAYSNDGSEEIQYSTFQVTSSQCGEDFYLGGKDRYDTQIREIDKYWSGW